MPNNLMNIRLLISKSQFEIKQMNIVVLKQMMDGRYYR